MIRRGGVNACRRIDQQGGRDRRLATGIGGDDHVFQHERCQQEVLVAGIRIERRACRHDGCRLRQRAEGAARAAIDVDRRLRHRRRTQRRAQERDMRDLVGGDLARILRDQRIGEGHLPPARYRALHGLVAVALGDQGGGQARAGYRDGVELRLEIGEVEQEVEAVLIVQRVGRAWAWRRRRAVGRARGRSARTAAGRKQRTAAEGERRHARAAQEVTTPGAAALLGIGGWHEDIAVVHGNSPIRAKAIKKAALSWPRW